MSSISDTRITFDGVALARQIEAELVRSPGLQGKRLLIVSTDPKSVYVRLKKEMGERLGVAVDVVTEIDKLESRMGEFDGVLVQLPVLGKSKEESWEIISRIPLDKDVDGMRVGSGVVPAVVRAVMKVIEVGELEFESVAVVGARGVVGSRVVEELKLYDYWVGEFDQGDDLTELINFEVVISATGAAGLISSNMVRDGFAAIDLGFPKADFSQGALEKASFYTPVPGGVGPLTVVSLFENLSEL